MHAQAAVHGRNWLRWLARGTGTLLASFWLFVGIAGAVTEREPLTVEGAIMSVLILVSAVGVVLAWWRERLGGLLLLALAAVHSVFAMIASGHNRGGAMLIAGGPYLVVGLLFLASERGAGASSANAVVS